MSSWPFVFAVVLCPAQFILSFFVFGSDSSTPQAPPFLFLVGMHSKQSKINYEKPSFRRMACMRMSASDVFSHA